MNVQLDFDATIPGGVLVEQEAERELRVLFRDEVEIRIVELRADGIIRTGAGGFARSFVRVHGTALLA